MTYTEREQNALAAIIRMCQRSPAWLARFRGKATLDDVPAPAKNNKFWKVLDKTPNKEALWLLLKWINSMTDTEISAWRGKSLSELEDPLQEFAIANRDTIVPDHSLSEDLMDLLALGLGPWPKGNGTE